MNTPKTQPPGNPEHSHVLNFSPKANAVMHEFAGSHDIGGATCPTCTRPLLRLLSLNARERLLALDETRTPLVHLLYCWNCSIPFGDFSYKINPDTSISILQIPEREPNAEFGPDGPYEGYTGVFPLRMVSVEPMNEIDDTRLAEARRGGDYDSLDKLFEPRHQIGGTPFIFNPQILTCPGCSREMPLLASICNDATGNQPWNDPWKPEAKLTTFVGNGGVQMIFHFCRDCAIVSAYQCCD